MPFTFGFSSPLPSRPARARMLEGTHSSPGRANRAGSTRSASGSPRPGNNTLSGALGSSSAASTLSPPPSQHDARRRFSDTDILHHSADSPAVQVLHGRDWPWDLSYPRTPENTQVPTTPTYYGTPLLSASGSDGDYMAAGEDEGVRGVRQQSEERDASPVLTYLSDYVVLQRG